MQLLGFCYGEILLQLPQLIANFFQCPSFDSHAIMALHASERLQSSYRPPLSICFFFFFFLLFLHCLTLFTRMNRNSCFLKEYKFSVLHFVFHKTKLRNAHAWRFKNLTKDQIDRNQYRQILRC